MPVPPISRRAAVRAIMASAAIPAGLGAAQRNIYWGLGAVTWTAKTKETCHWRDILPEVKEGGFDGFEPFTTRNLPVNDENMAEAYELAPKYNLRMSSIYWADDFHLPEQHPRILKDCHRFLGYLKKFNCDRLTIGPPGPNVEDEKVAIANLAKIMNAVGKIALDQYKIKTGIHPHVGGLIENPRQIESLMQQTDPRYFNLSPDTAQLWMGGGEVVSMMEKYKSRIVYIHYKDIRAYNRSLRNYGNNVIELGRGVIDFPALHRILKSVRYKGWITIDLDNARISPVESAKVQMEYIKRVLEPIYA